MSPDAADIWGLAIGALFGRRRRHYWGCHVARVSNFFLKNRELSGADRAALFAGAWGWKSAGANSARVSAAGAKNMGHWLRIGTWAAAALGSREMSLIFYISTVSRFTVVF